MKDEAPPGGWGLTGIRNWTEGGLTRRSHRSSCSRVGFIALLTRNICHCTALTRWATTSSQPPAPRCGAPAPGQIPGVALRRKIRRPKTDADSGLNMTPDTYRQLANEYERAAASAGDRLAKFTYENLAERMRKLA